MADPAAPPIPTEAECTLALSSMRGPDASRLLTLFGCHARDPCFRLVAARREELLRVLRTHPGYVSAACWLEECDTAGYVPPAEAVLGLFPVPLSAGSAAPRFDVGIADVAYVGGKWIVPLPPPPLPYVPPSGGDPQLKITLCLDDLFDSFNHML